MVGQDTSPHLRRGPFAGSASVRWPGATSPSSAFVLSENGEPMTRDQAREFARARVARGAPLPTPTEAREEARETGKMVPVLLGVAIGLISLMVW